MQRRPHLTGNSNLFHHGTPFSLRLTAHSSCVNALVWSGNGRWLATAGDDRNVALWDFHPAEPALAAPDIFSGSLANILCLAFTPSNHYILSDISNLSRGGVDGRILQYDIQVSRLSSSFGPRSGSGFTSTAVQGDGCIRAISPSPSQDAMFLAASEDGFVTAYDTRVPSPSGSSSLARGSPPRGVGRLSLDSEATGVQLHPFIETIFVTSDGRGRCKLWDTRTAFSSGSDTRQPDRSKRSLLQYVTKLSKPGRLKLSNPEASSVVFDATGTKLAITMLHFLPTIYNLGDEWPIAICSSTSTTTSKEPSVQGLPQTTGSTAQPLSERSYVNTCSIKHGSFGSPGSGRGRQKELYYGAGSDDFRGYVWRIPDGVSQYRQKIDYSDWVVLPESRGNMDVDVDTVGFAKSVTGYRIVPHVLDKPQFLIHGHKSIINTVLFHPFEPYIATAGIERHVLIHSPFGTTPICPYQGSVSGSGSGLDSGWTKTRTSVRQLLPNDNTNNSAPRRQSSTNPIAATSTSQQIDESFDRAVDTVSSFDDVFSDSDEETTVKYFDSILISEGVPDIFDIRAVSSSSGSEESFETTS